MEIVKSSKHSGLHRHRAMLVIVLAVAFLAIASVAEAVYDLPADRRVTWQGNVGITYRGGIPARTTICATLDSATYGNGTTDATSAINSAISSCPNGQTVYLPAGSYRINSTIVIPKTKSITLRGAGPGVTVIKSYSTNQDLNAAAIKIGDFASNSTGPFTGTNYCPQTAAPAGYVQDITAGGTRGSTTITVASAASIAVGDLGVINVLNNNDSSADLWTQSTNIGEEGSSSIYGYCCSSASTCRSLGQVVEVTGKSGNTLTISPPLYTDYTMQAGLQFSTIKSADVVKNVGVEDLTVENEQGTNGVNTMIGIIASYQVWLKNVETNYAKGRHVWIRHIALYPEVRDSYFHNSLTFVSNNYGVDMEQWVSGWLVENNMFDTIMSPIMLGTAASGGAAGYNYMGVIKYNNPNTWLIPGIAQHAAQAWMNLAEGNYITKILLDNIHGTEEYFTAFRNWIRYNAAPYDVNKTEDVNIEIMKGSRLHNFVGNILGYPQFPWRYQWNGETSCSNSGSGLWKFGYAGTACSTNWDAKSESTTLRHGNYDYVNNAIVWNGNDDQTLPVSLYLSSKPFWWGSQPWPPIGPDVSGYVQSIPAKDRFNGMSPPVSHTVTPSAGPNGSISPNSARTVNEGTTIQFTVTPSSGYTASVGGTCGGTLSGTTYTTNMITADCTVIATFTATTGGTQTRPEPPPTVDVQSP